MSHSVKFGELNCVLVNEQENPKGAVLLCHGFGAPGTDLVSIADEICRMSPELKDLLFVFPAAPIELDPTFDSRAWWMIDLEKIQALMARGEHREMRNTCPEELAIRREQIEVVVESVKEKYKLDRNKMIVGGFSQGAMLATDVALRSSKPFAGLIIWSGTLLCVSQWKSLAESQGAMDVVQSHGTLDPILPYSGAESLRDLISESGHRLEFVSFSGPHTIGMDAVQKSIDLMRTVLAD